MDLLPIFAHLQGQKNLQTRQCRCIPHNWIETAVKMEDSTRVFRTERKCRLSSFHSKKHSIDPNLMDGGRIYMRRHSKQTGTERRPVLNMADSQDDACPPAKREEEDVFTDNTSRDSTTWLFTPCLTCAFHFHVSVGTSTLFSYRISHHIRCDVTGHV